MQSTENKLKHLTNTKCNKNKNCKQKLKKKENLSINNIYSAYIFSFFYMILKQTNYID